MTSEESIQHHYAHGMLRHPDPDCGVCQAAVNATPERLRINYLNAHLDECEHCERNPFNLCKVGAWLLALAAGGAEAQRPTSVPVMTPVRVLINREADAVTPQCAELMGIVPEVIFVRKDGWSLGAPLKLRDVARAIWSAAWIEEWERTADGSWSRCAPKN